MLTVRSGSPLMRSQRSPGETVERESALLLAFGDDRGGHRVRREHCAQLRGELGRPSRVRHEEEGRVLRLEHGSLVGVHGDDHGVGGDAHTDPGADRGYDSRHLGLHGECSLDQCGDDRGISGTRGRTEELVPHDLGNTAQVVDELQTAGLLIERHGKVGRVRDERRVEGRPGFGRTRGGENQTVPPDRPEMR